MISLKWSLEVLQTLTFVTSLQSYKNERFALVILDMSKRK